MDAGCYSINYMRYLLGAEPTSVTNAECVAQPTSREVDDTTTATLAFADPATTATIACTLVGSIFNPLAVAKVCDPLFIFFMRANEWRYAGDVRAR